MSVTPIRGGVSLEPFVGVTGLDEPCGHEVHHSAVQLMKLAGITYRQVDYWRATKRIRACSVEHPGSGSMVLFSVGEVAVCVTVSRLLKAGLPLQASFDAARQMSQLGTRHFFLPGGILLVLPRPEPPPSEETP
jgi:hypothetical protein